MGKRAKREQRNAERKAVSAARAAAEAAAEAARWEQLLAEIRAQRCPSCCSAAVSRLSYGLPRFTDALNAALDADLIVLAGCSFAEDDPVWVCRGCKHTWGRLFPAEAPDAEPGVTPDRCTCGASSGLTVLPPVWRTDTVVSLAQAMRDARDYSALPILADALQDAGCDSAEILDHCRGPGTHVRGCWVVDLVLGKG